MWSLLTRVVALFRTRYILLALLPLTLSVLSDSTWIFIAATTTSVTLSILWLIIQYRIRVTDITPDEFLRRVERRRSEYCLLLRPFGWDGYTYLETADTRRFRFLTLRRTRTLEAIIAEVAGTELNIDTVTLVEPSQRVLPPGPTYLRATTTSWQQEITPLIQRALVIAFVLPRTASVSRSLKWEALQCIRSGLVGRTLFVVAPPQGTRRRAPRVLLELASVFSGLERTRGRTIVAFPQSVRISYSYVRKGAVIGDTTYANALQKHFRRIRWLVHGKELAKRYPRYEPKLN